MPDDPFAQWQEGGERMFEAYPVAGSSSSWQQHPPEQYYDGGASYAALEQEDDSCSSSATSSDDGYEDTNMPDLSQLTNAEAAEIVYYQYRAAKRNWRKFTGRPVRRFRRFFKRDFKRRTKGKGKGKSRGKTRGFFYTQDDVQVFLKGRGKGNRGHTSGKGHGRRQNPKDRDGNIMKCRICDSEEHLMARCPQNKGKGKGGTYSTPPGFTGLTFPESAPADPRSAGIADERAPWNDDTFHAPRETFSVFMVGSPRPDPAPLDPTWIADPWVRSSGLNFSASSFSAVQPQPSYAPWATYQAQRAQQASPRGPAQSPPRHPTGSPAQVDPEDELSDSQQGDQAAAEASSANAVPEARSYVGLPAGTPLHLQTDRRSMSDQQIMAILHGQMLAQPKRTPQSRPPAAQRLRNHDLPLAVAPSLSHRPRTRMTLTPPPAQPNMSYERAIQAVELTKRLRNERRREQVSARQPAPVSTASSPASTPMPPLIPGAPNSVESPRAMGAAQINRNPDDAGSVRSDSPRASEV